MSIANRPHLWATMPPLCNATPYGGEWENKYWKNFPGPYYSTTDNMLSGLASNAAPQFLVFDDAPVRETCEFFLRQPILPAEYQICLAGMMCDEVGSYAVDGNQYWTPVLVREWWDRKSELIVWAEKQLLKRDDPKEFRYGNDDATDRSLFREYIRYLNEDAEEYLRSYVFLLFEGRPAKAGDRLPGI